MDSDIKPNPLNRLDIVKSWENPEHFRLRIQPTRRDVEYPVLSDLKNFIKQNSSSKKITVLDFGAGSSPYRLFFSDADYRRADILEIPGLRYRIGSDSKIVEQSDTFDLVLSTQVLEHVADVHAYLAESFRVLKPGGTFLVTTHGIWEEHGVPYDFQRWTEEGLKRDLKLAGYKEVTVFKLTCGLRGVLFLFIKGLFAAKAPTAQPARLIFKIFRTTVAHIFPWLYCCCDKFWPEDNIVRASPETASQTFYIVIGAIARK